MDVYRILKEPYWTDPLSVVGAEKSAGRWNPPGLGILYTSSSPALALLETMVHFPAVNYDDLPALRLFTLRVPDDEIRWINPAFLPQNWDDPVQRPVTQTYFWEWLSMPLELVLAVPSVVLDVSYNFLVHPKHPRFEEMKILYQKNIDFERRLWKN